MEPYQQRVVDEKAELDAKIAKLDAFTLGDVFAALPVCDRVLMLRQMAAMLAYVSILEVRIERFAATA